MYVCVVNIVTGAVQDGSPCSASVAASPAPGDRSYQGNMVLLTEIGFLFESLVQGYKLKRKQDRERGAQTNHFPCSSIACACCYAFA